MVVTTPAVPDSALNYGLKELVIHGANLINE
jgi:hypothetical protein